MAGIIPATDRMSITRRRLLNGSMGVFAALVARNTWAQEATPEVDDEAPLGPARLLNLLSIVPADMASGEDLILFWYADVQLQLQRSGIPIPQPNEQLSPGLMDAIQPLALVSNAYQYALDEEFLNTFGIFPLQVERTLLVGRTPSELNFFAGGMDIDSLPGIWEASGYEREDTDAGVPIWTVGKNGEMNVDTAVTKFGLGGMNNVTILDDVVVFGRNFTDVEAVVNLHAEPGDAFIDQYDLRETVLSFSSDAVSIVAAAPEFLSLSRLAVPELQTQTQVMVGTANEEAGVVAKPVVALFGTTASVVEDQASPVATPVASEIDGEPGLIETRIRYASAEEAEQSVTAINWRWENWQSLVTRRPYTDLMTIVAAAPDEQDSSIAAIDFREVAPAGTWLRVISQQDVLPFAWADAGEAEEDETGDDVGEPDGDVPTPAG